MKTLVIQLDHSEDIGSIRDKVTWGKSSRVLLVWPVNDTVFDRKVDLVTIKRICTSQGSRLGIVCDDPVVCAEAEELQIPVFESVSRAMRKGWDRRRRKRANSSTAFNPGQKQGIEDLRIATRKKISIPGFPKYIQIIFFGLGILSVLLLILVILPSARVRIYPLGQTQEMKVELQVDNQEGGASNPGIIHAASIMKTIEGEIESKTTGSAPVADQKARGSISITNRTKSKIEIPAQTIVLKNSNPPERYYLLQNVTISPEESVTGVTIEAIYAGKNGNSTVNTITRIDGVLGLQVELTNPEPISGGNEKNIPAPSAEDVQKLRDDLEKKMTVEAEKQISIDLEPDEVLLQSSIKAEKILSEKVTPEIGQVGISVKLSQKAEYSAQIIHHKNLIDQAAALLAINRLSPGWVISNRVPVEVQIISQEFNRATNTVKMQTMIKGQVIPVINTDTIRHTITGTNRELAEMVIASQVVGDQPPEIETWPIWLPYLPWLESRISVITS
jgi:hypothetical protein